MTTSLELVLCYYNCELNSYIRYSPLVLKSNKIQEQKTEIKIDLELLGFVGVRWSPFGSIGVR